MEESRKKDEKIDKLLETIREKDTKIAKLEAQVENMKKFFDNSNKTSRQIVNQKLKEEIEKDNSSTTTTYRNVTSLQKTSTNTRSPYMTRRTTSQSSQEAVGTAEPEKEHAIRFRNPPPDGSKH